MQKSTIFALLILAVMTSLMIGSVINDSLTFDELAHIAAGFGYVTQQDYRFNAEHPPLLKALAALSAELIVHPVYPTTTHAWQDETKDQWAQWTQGTIFLYQSGNDADRIIFWARFPLLLLTLFFGWLLFWWIRKDYGKTPAFLAILLYAFSPTVLTHGRFVTTDVGAALGFFIGIITFIKFLEHPTNKNILLAGIIFGVAELLKFSVILLLPLYGTMLLGWVLTRPYTREIRLKLFWHLSGKTIVIGLIGLVVIWMVYSFFTFHYPLDRNLRDAETLLRTYRFKPFVNIDLSLIQHRFTRPLGQYLLGVLLATQRTAGGNTVFFLGELAGTGSKSYFPIMYALKEPLAFHLLTLIAIFFAISQTVRCWREKTVSLIERLSGWIRRHFPEFSCLGLLVIYWTSSILSPLNIGIRHILPVIPLTYFLVSLELSKWLTWKDFIEPSTWWDIAKNLYSLYLKPIPRYFYVFILLGWIIIDTVLLFPHFMAYYNELAGGPQNGYNIATDSNYDWGQDLKRLKQFVDENHIDHIAITYFGGGNLQYYFGDKAETWWSSRGNPHGWFAISSNERQGAFARLAPGFTGRKPEDTFEWLKPFQPITAVGYSIFIYKLP